MQEAVEGHYGGRQTPSKFGEKRTQREEESRAIPLRKKLSETNTTLLIQGEGREGQRAMIRVKTGAGR